MFDKITKGIKCAEWMKADERYWLLNRYDLLLNGCFYDHLHFAFYEEVDPANGKLVPIEDRRPSAQFNIPQKVSRDISRKLFAGRHVPRVHHPDKTVQKKLRRLIKRANLYRNMREIAFRGAVGSVAATFVIHGDPRNPNIQIDIWPAKYCEPSFDEAGDLESLRIQYVTAAGYLTALGAPGLDAAKLYWCIRDFTKEGEIWIQPIEKDDWNPLEGFKNEKARTKGFAKWEDKSSAHSHEMVLAQWFKNLAGGQGCDGACTFAPSISTMIDIDYTMSQLGRGVRYNAAPQLVTIGEVQNADDAVVRSPMHHLQMSAGSKNDDGETYGAGDAKLLEMTGTGVEAGLKFVDKLRNLALEQISAGRKDPEQMKGPMSGRAMEYLDDDWHDLVMELRSSYGEDGMLPFLKKIALSCEKFSGANDRADLEQTSLTWPRLFQPTPADLQQIMPALQIAIDPFGVAERVEQAGGGGGEGGAPAKPVPQKFPGEGQQLLTVAEARNWLRDNMDIGVLDDDDEADDEPSDDDAPPPADDLPPAPAPLEDGGGPTEDDDVPGDDPMADPFAQATAGGVGKVTRGRPT